MITFTPALAQSYAPALSRGSHSTAGMAADRFELRFGGTAVGGVPTPMEQFIAFARRSRGGQVLEALARLQAQNGESVGEIQSRWIEALWEDRDWTDQVKRRAFLEALKRDPSALEPEAQETLVRSIWGEHGTDPERTLLREFQDDLSVAAADLCRDFTRQDVAPVLEAEADIMDDVAARLGALTAELREQEAVVRGDKKS